MSPCHRTPSSLSLLDHAGKNDDVSDATSELIDDLIGSLQKQNQQLKEHLTDENKAIEDLVTKK